MSNSVEDLDKVITYRYRFRFSNGIEKEFNAKLHKENLNLVQTERKSYPEWTELRCSKCPHCPLDENQHPFCPIAVSLVDLVDFFRNSLSYEEVDVLVETEARKYTKHTTLQSGLSSLIGIYMVTSGCPVMEKLKPMVRHHLPFATLEETTYRVISMYLLAQYFLYRRSQNPDWQLKELVKAYDDIRIVNQSFCKRLSHVKVRDASVNAVVMLNMFAEFVPFSISENMLDEIELLFDAYLKAD